MYKDPICGCGETRDGMQARGGEGRRGEARGGEGRRGKARRAEESRGGARGGHKTRQNEAAAIERGWRGRGRRSATS